ncbi:sensor histidine kinase [Nocardia panacis]|uniref:histidine kinase n=1 Tax=Nocardia panacis TaxID=2340916 RepID=A0A3A4JRT1_9NOCA|nr:HAMP domain-containing sensor histidine kinase [Nocardia panacis]RJO72259.1 sensor histidine kinase [Nocardia panacis]
MLGIVVAVIDARSRAHAVDETLDRVVTGLWHGINLKTDEDAVDTDQLKSYDLANGELAVVVLTATGQGHWKQTYTHLRSWLPTEAGIKALADDAVQADILIYRDDADTVGRPVRLAARPLSFSDTSVQTVIIAGTNPGARDRDRSLLVWSLVVGGAVLVALSSGVAHLLSGRSIRQALTMVDEQERFLGDAAHELRTPLATLRLITEPRPRAPNEIERALADARGLGERLERIVAGLLARARLQAGVATVEQVQLLLDQLTEAVVEEFPHARVTVRTEPCVVVGDPALLSLAVRNLIENAITHGAVNSQAPVEVYVAQGRVSVRDHGTGPAPSLSSNPFQRGITGGRGSGIGLALVAWIADVHGGTATMEPAAGGGTIVALALPPG